MYCDIIKGRKSVNVNTKVHKDGKKGEHIFGIVKVIITSINLDASVLVPL
jgi:hypothetical protein